MRKEMKMRNLDREHLLLVILILVLGVSAAVMLQRENGRMFPADNISDRHEKIILLSWWGNDPRHKYTMEGVNHFADINPDVVVNYRYGEWNGYEKKTKVWMLSDTEADVMQINYAWLDEYSADGTGFYDLNDLADYIDLDAFTDEQKAYGTRNGHLNALPIAMNSHIFYYNQDVLDSYGIAAPTSWDEMFAAGKKLKADDRYLLGMGKKQMFLLIIAYYEQSTGKAMFNSDGSFNATPAEMADLLVFYRQMLDDHVLCPVEMFDKSKYMDGEIVGTMCWISDTQKYCDAIEEKGVNVSRCLYPLLPDAKRTGWYMKPATMWAISSDVQHPEEAALLLNYLLNDPYMIKLQGTEKGVPVSSKAIEVLDGEGLKDTNEYAATKDIMAHSREMNLIISNMEKEAIIEIFKQNADEYLFDRMNADECAKVICKEIRKACSK